MPSSFPIKKFKFSSDSIFRGLPEEELHYLESRMITKMYKKGQSIFIEGTFPTRIYYVKEGKVKKFKTDREGREQIFYICNQGELFGYPALLSGDAYPDSAAALEDSKIGYITKEDFFHVLHRSAILSNRLLQNLSHEFAVLVNNISSYAQKSVRERLALNLIILKDKFTEPGKELELIEIRLSREDLANMVGTAIETLVRLLHDFKREGLIETKGRIIRILNTKELIKIANFY